MYPVESQNNASVPECQRDAQRAKILELFLNARGAEVSLLQIPSLGIAQFGARIYEFRHELGFRISNRTGIINGQRRSWYRPESGSPKPQASPQPLQPSPPPEVKSTLFGDISPDRSYSE